MNCDLCGGPGATICRVRRGRASYFCIECMNLERDSPDGVMKGDMWFAVRAESTTEQRE